MVIDEYLEKFLLDNDYTHLQVIDGRVCGISRFIFTWGLCVGLNPVSFEYRYCFHTLQDALAALADFDGTQDPEDFIVRKGLGEDYRPNDEFNAGLPLTEILQRIAHAENDG
jgi:hypothetical protein